MFGFFKKKAAPPPSVQLSDDELDLIHGGRQLNSDVELGSSNRTPEFDGSAAVVAVVGPADARFGNLR